MKCTAALFARHERQVYGLRVKVNENAITECAEIHCGSVIVPKDGSKDKEHTGTTAVEERHRIDETSLDCWMREHVEGYAGPLTLLQFKGHQSIPTYKLDTSSRSYVMRRKPFGKLLPSAHAVDRELRVISALARQGFPVAYAYALCMDNAVIGAPFYVMSMEEGRVSGIRRCLANLRKSGQKSSGVRSRRFRSCICSIPKR